LAKKSARLKLGWSLKILHGIRAELKGSRNFSSQKSWDNSHFIGQNFEFIIFSRKGSMATGLKVEDKLDGAANFGAWKERMIFLLKENELWDIVENTTTHPVVIPIDATLLAAYTKKSIKAKRIILDSIKDHFIPHLTGKQNAYEMRESLTKLYQSTNENRKMVFREKLKSIKMTKAENVVTYLTTLTQVRDELGAMGEAIVDNELVRTALNGVSKQWVVFVEGIVAREKLPNWERLWDEFFRRRLGEVMYMAVHL
jgi:hypothetical protein